MEFLTSDPIFRHFGLSALLILTKMLSMSLITSSRRIKHGKFANKEDAQFSKPTGPVDIKTALRSEDEVERVRRAHLNDLENIYPFVLVGFFFVGISPSLSNAQFHFYGFVVARFAHTISYLNQLQPARAICFLSGFAITISMAVQVLMTSF